MAVINRHLDVVKFLLSKHANQIRRDEYEKTALDYANDCPAATFILNTATRLKRHIESLTTIQV